MKKEKIMELLKNKKVQLIGSLALCGVLVVGAAFFMMKGSKSTINSKVTSVVQDENKEEVKVTNEEEAKKELEELKKADTSKLTEEEKKQTEEKIKSIETMIENKEYEKAQQEVESVKNNVASDVETTVNKVEENKEETTKVEEKKNEPAKVETPDKIETPKKEEKKAEPVKTHTHTWVDVTEEVVHAEEGHWEEVVVTPEQVKEVPVYERNEREICNGCGADITGSVVDHIKSQMLSGNMACNGFHSDWRETQVGTKQEVTPAVTEKKWVVDKAASTETKVVGQKCSGCGAIE